MLNELSMSWLRRNELLVYLSSIGGMYALRVRCHALHLMGRIDSVFAIEVLRLPLTLEFARLVPSMALTSLRIWRMETAEGCGATIP